MMQVRRPMMQLRHDWTLSQVEAIYRTPLLELVFHAASVHRQFHDPSQVQVCKLISIKTGGCPEDCAYCSQSSRYETGIDATSLMDLEVSIERRHGPSSWDATVLACKGLARGAPVLVRVPSPALVFRPGDRVRLLDAQVASAMDDDPQPAIATMTAMSEAFLVPAKGGKREARTGAGAADR